MQTRPAAQLNRWAAQDCDNMNVKRCLFCGSAHSLSKEHIIPQWLLKEIGLDDQQIAMSHVSTFGVTKSQRAHSFTTLVNAQVCQECNSGWMSKLEVSVKDIITSLMRLEDVKGAIGALAQTVKQSRDGVSKPLLYSTILPTTETLSRRIISVLYTTQKFQRAYTSIWHSRIMHRPYFSGDRAKLPSCLAPRKWCRVPRTCTG